MENLKILLQDNLNKDFISAVLSNPRTKGGMMKVKVRPLMKKDTLFFQLETFRGNQAFHRNLEPGQAVEEISTNSARLTVFWNSWKMCFRSFRKTENLRYWILDAVSPI